MSYQVRFTREAKEDLERLFRFQLELDVESARRAREAIEKGMEFVKEFPFSCRKADPSNPFFREMVISFGASGYVVMFEIEDEKHVTILAVRHQHEEDYH